MRHRPLIGLGQALQIRRSPGIRQVVVLLAHAIDAHLIEIGVQALVAASTATTVGPTRTAALLHAHD